ncbi:Afadin [Taenia crassiceps]|uniref:Afadin n=1 Tax=Taenia crassiceps TaxID=6207 RepID=A0ABR4QA18_9CEST
MLGFDEYPLLVQLNWSKLGQEGKFILKITASGLASSKSDGQLNGTKSSDQLKRSVKKPEKKPFKSGVGIDSLFCGRGIEYDENENIARGCGPRMRKHVSDDQKPLGGDLRSTGRCHSPPNSTFTRMISDPEILMQKTRQQVLSSKLSQFAGKGSDDIGGTLKIYGELVDPSVPYKTLLLSTRDSVSQVIRQALDKYGLEFADPAAYCLVMRTRYANEIPGMQAYEEILQDDFCPLKLLLAPESSPEGIITTFELRPRLTRIDRQRNATINGENMLSSALIRLPYHQNNCKASQDICPTPINGQHNSFACLVEVSSEGKASHKPAIYPLPLHLGQVCVGTSLRPSTKFPLLVTLPVNVHPEVIPFHVVIWQPQETTITTTGHTSRCSPRGWLACAPVAHETLAPVLVNGRLLTLPSFQPFSSDRKSSLDQQPTLAFHWLAPGDVIQLGAGGCSRFRIWPGPSPPPPPKPSFLLPATGALGCRSTTTSKLSVSTPISGRHKCQPSGAKTQTPQLHQHRQHRSHHHHYQTHHNSRRPTSMESTKSDLSDTTTSSSLPLSPTPPSIVETEATKMPRESLPMSSPSCRTPSIVTGNKSTSTRGLVDCNLLREDSSSSTSQTLSTSGIGTCTKHTDSRSGNALSIRRTSSDSGAPPLLDRLPCQLAYAPSTLDALLDWLLLDPFRARRNGLDSEQEISPCSLGPSFSVYLMLRAICRQCDRWEALENRKMAAVSISELKTKQLIRRQRELLALFVAVTDRLVSMERHLNESCADESASSREALEERAGRGAAILSNISQLLHFISKDVDLQRIFQTNAEGECGTAWLALVDRVAELVESVFNSLLATLTALIASKSCLPALVASWDLRANTCRDNEVEEEGEEGEGEEIEITDDTSIDDPSDPVLDELTKVLGILHTNLVNPAFLVQLFARLLHYIGARLFNGLVEEPARVSPQWGRLLFEWIHKKLVGWAEPQGLRVAVECYLTRLSQAADLMQADTTTVEGLYNTAVDLDRLNSTQVRFLLRAYRPSYARPLLHLASPDTASDTASEHIPAQWIDFVISGVSQVSDRLLAEESEQPDWKPQLLEALDLQLPLLLPDDCYPSSTPIRNPHLEPSTSALAKPQVHEVETMSSKSQLNAVEVAHLTAFLQPALLSGWCRLSVRQVPSLRTDPWLSWDVYLAIENASSANVDRLVEQSEPPRDSPGPKTPPAFEAPSPPLEGKAEISQPDSPAHESASDFGSSNTSESLKAEEARNVRIFTVSVPKIGNNLGLSIVAARSEDGSDLGIYVKSVTPGGGASQARWLGEEEIESPPQPPIGPGDRILAVDGQETRGLSQDAAARLVSLAGSEVRLTLARNLGLGCVAAAVSTHELRKRNDQAVPSLSATVASASSTSPLQPTEAVNMSVMANPTKGVLSPVPPKACATVVRAATITTTKQQDVEQVEVNSDGGEAMSPPLPRVLVETQYLLAHEVPSSSAIQRSRSLMTHETLGRRFSVERGSWDSTATTVYSQTSSSTTDTSATNRVSLHPTNNKAVDRIPRATKVLPLKDKQYSSWDEMDVDATLEMLKEMRDQLDRSLALRNQRIAPLPPTAPLLSTTTEWKSSYTGGRLRDCGEPGPLNPPRTAHSSLDKVAWKEVEESSAFRTTSDRKYSGGIVRSASTYSPLTYKSSSSVDDPPRGQFLFRTPTATFVSGGPGVTRSNTSDRLHCAPKAIYSVRVPFKHNVSTDHLQNRGHPASATATSRSYDFELEHRRTQSADQTLSDGVDVGRRPSVAERVKLFQNVIENQCK